MQFLHAVSKPSDGRPCPSICSPKPDHNQVLKWELANLTIFACLVAFSFYSFSPALFAAEEESTWHQHGVVASDHPLAAAAGLDILKQGGNAIDAAVATSFALSVVRPGSCGLGGGGFMLVWLGEEKRALVLDYRERAPALATRDMFKPSRNDHRPPELNRSRVGGLAVGIPGTVAGLCTAQKRFGKLTLKEVLQPAIQLCKTGIPLDHHAREVQLNLIALFTKYRGLQTRFQTVWNQFLNRGTPWKPTDRFYSPQLLVLEQIAEQGPQAFYEGPIAKSLVSTVIKAGGILTLNDLANFKPQEREALTGEFQGHQVFTMPPPSSGGIAILQILGTLEAHQAQQPDWWKAHASSTDPHFLHLLVEAKKHAFADRAEYLGDTDFHPVPIKELLSTKNLAERAASIQFNGTKPTNAYGNHFTPDDSGTSHVCVMDQWGNAVACTETINTAFGSLVVDPDYGIVLNNEMDDFAAVPGQPNAFGLIQGEANSIEPGKKPLSSMSPTILVKNDEAVLAVGGSGGPRIISGTLQVILQRVMWKQEIATAVRASRLHHQWLPNNLFLEPNLFNHQAGSLLTLGHKVKQTTAVAAVQATVKSKQGFQGANDPRKSEVVEGVGY